MKLTESESKCLCGEGSYYQYIGQCPDGGNFDTRFVTNDGTLWAWSETRTGGAWNKRGDPREGGHGDSYLPAPKPADVPPFFNRYCDCQEAA